TDDGLILTAGSGAMNRAPTGSANTPTIGDVVRSFKAVSTRRIRASGRPDFGWQRNYYEHVIRTEAALDRIREYIVGNPDHWADDEENPDNPRNRGIN
ncbi:MAG: transposase, partial [Dehalococcoidia bacterium]